MILYIFLALIWYALGFFGVAYWWTKDFDFTFGIEVFIAFIFGFTGPLSWGIGYLVHGTKNPNKIIFKKQQ